MYVMSIPSGVSPGSLICELLPFPTADYTLVRETGNIVRAGYYTASSPTPQPMNSVMNR